VRDEHEAFAVVDTAGAPDPVSGLHANGHLSQLGACAHPDWQRIVRDGGPPSGVAAVSAAEGPLVKVHAYLHCVSLPLVSKRYHHARQCHIQAVT
jgi:hypothetical protein